MALNDLLLEIAEYLDDCSDVHDGSDGTPQPNRAMVLRHELEQFLLGGRVQTDTLHTSAKLFGG